MNDILKIVFSLSLSGSLLSLTLFLCKPLFQNRLSKRWQYYIWLIVITRLLLPFTPKISLMGMLFEQTIPAVSQTAPSYQIGDKALFRLLPESVSSTEPYTLPPEADDTPAAAPAPDTTTDLLQYLWIIWLLTALLLLIRKITLYQSFVSYLKAGWQEVSDIKLLDRLSQIGEQIGVRRPVELYTNSLISSPLLLGFFCPCIVLPTADLPDTDFQYTIQHELIHYRRRDIFYKWLVQVTICLHWFNPLVWLTEREINRACELACDEAVIRALNEQERLAYGNTLLQAMGNGGGYQNSHMSVTLTESAKLLKERLAAIMNFKKNSGLNMVLSLILTALLIAGSAATGSAASFKVLPAPIFVGQKDTSLSILPETSLDSTDGSMETLKFNGTTYYLVFNEAQLRAIGTGEYGLDKNYIQQADIHMSAEEWTPIGTMEHPFTGSYNGNGFEIIGLTMTDPDATVIGLFGAAKNAHIYNITMRDYDIMSAGKDSSTRSVAPILALGLGGVRSYDNVASPKKAAYLTENYLTDKYLTEKYYDLIEQYYEDNNYAGFSQILFWLNDTDAEAWLTRSYQDNQIAFFSIVLHQLEPDEETLEIYLRQAVQDNRIHFQAMLLEELDRDFEYEKLKTELDNQILSEYQNYGITKNGKQYYYQNQLIHIFLDIRANSSFYTLEINPQGTVNIKVTRDADNTIRSVDYMTEEEISELFGDIDELDE